MYSPATAGFIITACAVLHNIMVDSKYPLPPEADIIGAMDDPNNNLNEFVADNDPLVIRNAGFRAREQLIREFF